jgi:adenylate kinase family enzyme
LLRRIVITGCSGSGKSTLARQLGQRLGLPVVHLDVLFWCPGWKERDTADFRTRVTQAHAGNAWISEGNYITKTFDLRLPRADIFITLDRSRWLCLVRVVSRVIFRRARADLAEGCPEHFDWELLVFIWNFEQVTRPRIEAARLALCPDVPVIRLRSEREIAAFLAAQHEMRQSTEPVAPKVMNG